MNSRSTTQWRRTRLEKVIRDTKYIHIACNKAILQGRKMTKQKHEKICWIVHAVERVIFIIKYWTISDLEHDDVPDTTCSILSLCFTGSLCQNGFPLGSPVFSQKHASRCIDYTKV